MMWFHLENISRLMDMRGVRTVYSKKLKHGSITLARHKEHGKTAANRCKAGINEPHKKQREYSPKTIMDYPHHHRRACSL